jgi:molecular chaperone GrpE (heat shock protein)
MNILDRLSDAWNGITGQTAESARAHQDEILSLKRQLAEAVLELRESQAIVAAQKSVIEDSVTARTICDTDHMEDLFTALAAPASQLRVQAFLMNGGKELTGQSVMALAGQFVTLVERAGLEPVGSIGDRVEYDPALHQPLSAQASILDRESVIIKFVGYTYRGRVIRRCLVQKA